MKYGWQTRLLGEICSIRPPKSEARQRLNPDADVSFLPMEDLGTEAKFVTPRRTRSLANVAGSYTYFADGDVLLPKISPCFENGKLGIARCLVNGVGFGSSEYIVLRPSGVLADEWLYYFLSRSEFREEGIRLTYGTVGQRRIPNEFIGQYAIPVPSIAEQWRVVAVLDKACAGIAKARESAEKNLRNARALLESHLESVFAHPDASWVRRRLDEVACDFGRGKSKHRPRNDPKLYGGRYPFIQTGDIRSSRHRIEAYSQTYNDAGLAQSKLWPAGTVCITIAANIAETGILAFDACFPDSVIGVVADETRTSGRFLEYMLQSFKLHLQALGKGSAQANINLATFANQVFPFPDLDGQAEIAGTLDLLDAEVQRLEAAYERKLSRLDELKQSLLHQAFSGQL